MNEDIGQNGHVLAVFVTLLGWACRFETKINHGGKQKPLPAGSVVFGIRELAKHLRFSKDTVYRSLKYLEKRDTICVTPDTRGTVATFCNWAKYQIDFNLDTTPARHDLRHEPDTDATPVRHEPTLNGQVNKRTIRQGNKKTNVGIRTNYPQEFEEIWTLYERKGDKRKSHDIWKKLTLSQSESMDLIRAIKTYLSAKPDKQFRKDLQNFLIMDWRDLASPEIIQSPSNGHDNAIHPNTAARIQAFEQFKAMAEAREDGDSHEQKN